jgi:hypothetical protein
MVLMTCRPRLATYALGAHFLFVGVRLRLLACARRGAFNGGFSMLVDMIASVGL